MACGCSNGSGTCGSSCSTCLTSGVPPFYNQAGSSQECHDTPAIQQQLIASLSSGSDFILPAVGNVSVVFFRNVRQLQVGSYIWNATYGYFRVTYFNDITGETQVINDGIGAFATPGSFIPRGTLFTITTLPFIAVAIPGPPSPYVYIWPLDPPPFAPGDPFSLDVVSIVGNIVTLEWHSVPIVP